MDADLNRAAIKRVLGQPDAAVIAWGAPERVATDFGCPGCLGTRRAFRPSRSTVVRPVASGGGKTDITKVGLNSIPEGVVKNNLKGISPQMEKKGWVDAQGRKGKVGVARPHSSSSKAASSAARHLCWGTSVSARAQCAAQLHARLRVWARAAAPLITRQQCSQTLSHPLLRFFPHMHTSTTGLRCVQVRQQVWRQRGRLLTNLHP